MKTLEIYQLEEIHGGGVSDVVNGICAALAVANYFGWIVLMASPAGQAAAGVCLVNAIGSGAGWW